MVYWNYFLFKKNDFSQKGNKLNLAIEDEKNDLSQNVNTILDILNPVNLKTRYDNESVPNPSSLYGSKVSILIAQ